MCIYLNLMILIKIIRGFISAQYLFSLEQELIKLGMQDDGLNDLLVSVKKLLAENYPDGVLRPGFA